MTRRGFTLTELIVTMTVLAVLGTGLARLLINNSRFVARQDAQLEARHTSRAALNVMATELRGVTDGGVAAATATDITVRVPYAFGMLCGTWGSSTVMTLMPSDSAVYADALPRGIAWRQANGRYARREGITVTPSTRTAACTADSVRSTPGSRLIEVDQTGLGPSGSIGYLYQTVRYRFTGSTVFPGRVALTRTVNGGAEQELLAPFAPQAGFWFLVGAQLLAQAAPPAVLDSIQGLELRLIAESEITPVGQTGPMTFDLRPRVKFVNR